MIHVTCFLHLFIMNIFSWFHDPCLVHLAIILLTILKSVGCSFFNFSLSFYLFWLKRWTFIFFLFKRKRRFSVYTSRCHPFTQSSLKKPNIIWFNLCDTYQIPVLYYSWSELLGEGKLGFKQKLEKVLLLPLRWLQRKKKRESSFKMK